MTWKKNCSIFFAALFKIPDEMIILSHSLLLDCNPIVQRCFLFLMHPIIPRELSHFIAYKMCVPFSFKGRAEKILGYLGIFRKFLGYLGIF